MDNPRKTNLPFSAACLGMFLFGIVFLSLGTISTFIQEKFSLDALTAGSLASSLPFGILLGSMIFGPVADRYGYKIVLSSSAFMIFIAMELIARAGTPGLFKMSFFIIGMGGGIINGGTNALAADLSSEEKSSRLSLLGIFFGIGALAMPALIGFLNQFWDYNIIFTITGLFIFLIIIFFLLVKYPEPKQKQGFPIKAAFNMVRNPLILAVGFILFFESGLEGMVSNWTTSYLKNLQFTDENALFALSVQVVALILGRLLLSRLLKFIPAFFAFLACISLIMAGAVSLGLTHGLPGVMISLFLLGTGFSAGFPVMLGLTGHKFPDYSGTAFSVVIVMALLGNTSLNYLTGMVSKNLGISYFPLLLAVSAGCMAVLLLSVKKHFKNT